MSDNIRFTLGHINLRGNSGDQRFVDGVQSVLGQALPIEPNTLSSGTHRVYWLGPDEWQIVTDGSEVIGLLQTLEKSLDGQHVAVNDVSGGQLSIHLPGANVPEQLAKGCTLDLHPTKFGLGACAQSGLAKANVLLGFIGDEPLYELIVRRSFSDYLLRWLRHAGLVGDTGE